MNKSKIFMIVSIIILIISIVGSTLAFFIWTGDESSVSITVSSGTGSCTLQSDNNIELFPTSSKFRSRKIRLTAKQQMASKAYITWDLVVNDIEGLQDKSFNYELINNTTGESYGTGNFEGITKGSTITFSNDKEVLGYNIDYTFTLYLWIDGESFNNPLTMSDQVFDFDIACNITGTDDGTVQEQNVLMSVTSSQSATSTFLRSDLQRGQIGSITFEDTNTVPEGENIISVDVSKNIDGSIMLWYYNETNENGFYDIHIGSRSGKIYLESGEYLFDNLRNVETLDLSKFNTSKVPNMEYMFQYTGYNTTTFELNGLENWDTSSVTDMSYMFQYTGYKASTFELNGLENWDTSKVINMSYMFYQAGRNATSLSLDLSNWNTSKVQYMNTMFAFSGYSETTFNLDLSNWDTSKVINMSYMFYQAGRNATTWTVKGLSSWDTSSVTDMSYMFLQAAENKATSITLDLSNWNTSSVKTMKRMFYSFGQNATTFILDISNWDTSNVGNMSEMFYDAGASAKEWSIGDISNWNTSKVTTMYQMFGYAGYSATEWTIGDISKKIVTKSDGSTYTAWDTSNVGNMSEMFYDAGASAKEWSIGDIGNWDTSSVTNMKDMFVRAGKSATNWSLDLSTKTVTLDDGTSYTAWDVSKVTSYSNFNFEVESKIKAPVWVN